MNYKRVIRMLLVSALVCSMTAMPIYAAPADTVENLEEEQDNLQNQKSSAQGELNSLQMQLETLLSKSAELEDKLAETGQKISKAEEDLAEAEAKRENQYDSMKLRIKYLYESGGNTAMLEKVLTSGDITSMLTQAEYSQQVHNYDRDQLQEYVDTVQKIQELEETLESEMTDLQNLEGEYEDQQIELNATISSKRDEISDLDGMLQEAARKIMSERERQEAAEQSENGSGAENGNETAGDNSSATDADNSSGGTADNGSGSDANSGDNSGDGETGEDSDNDTSHDEPAESPDSGNDNASDYDSSAGSAAVSRAHSQLGDPYEWGAAGPDSFDCSGLVSYCLTGSYVHTWSTSDFIGWPRVSNPQPGDVCIKPGHCGLYIGNGMMIHAPHTGDVVKIAPVQSGMFYVRY